MADPSEKSHEMGMFLEGLSGRTSAIHDDKCIDPPFGCGGPATEFRDDVSAREYQISGMCQICQDRAFGSVDEAEWEEECNEDDMGYPGRYDEDDQRDNYPYM
jgi:hypothetical protein